MDTPNPSNNQDFTYALIIPERSDELPVCLAARQSGLYISENGGRSWLSAYTSLSLEAPLPTTCLAASPGFAADRLLFAGVPGGVLISEDGGANWLSAQLPNPLPLPSALAVSPDFVKDRTLFLGTSEDGVLRSTNQGSSWKAWNFGLIDFNVLSLAISPGFANDQTVFAGTSTGLAVSRTGGCSWKDLPLPSGPTAVLSLALSPDFSRDGCLWVGTEGAGLFTSTDRGKSWIRLGEGLLDGMINHLLLPEAAPGLVYAIHEDSLFSSNDAGQSWKEVISGDVACIAASKRLYPFTLLVSRVDGAVQPL